MFKPRGKGIIDRKIVLINRIYVVELEGKTNVGLVMDWKAAIVTNCGKQSGIVSWNKIIPFRIK